jgi:hypothetical protein
VCGEPDHIARKCHQRKGKNDAQRTVNVVVSEAGGSGYEPEILLACQSTEWWLDTKDNIHVCSDLNLFSTYQVANGCSILMGNGSRVAVQGVGRRNLISDSLLCRGGFQLVFESNKFIVSKFGLLTSKGSVCGGLFRLSVVEDCNKFVNLTSCFNSEYNDGEATVWHSRLCVILILIALYVCLSLI